MHRRWRDDPASVHASWDVYFSGLDKGLPSEAAFRPPPSLMPLPVDAPPIDHESLASGESVDDHLKVRQGGACHLRNKHHRRRSDTLSSTSFFSL